MTCLRQKSAQGRAGVLGAEQLALLQDRDEHVDDDVEVVDCHPGSEPEAVDTLSTPLTDPVGEFGRRPGEHECIRVECAARECVETPEPLGAALARCVEEDHEVRVHPQRFTDTPDPHPRRRDLVDEVTHAAGVRRGDEHQICLPRGQFVRKVAVGQQCDHRLPLRRSGRDRRPSNVEEPAFEVDVVQLVAVDEPSRLHVAELRVVLPAVPQPPNDLDGVGGLVEQVVDELGQAILGERLPVALVESGDVAPAEVCGLLRGGGHLDLPAGATVRCVVEGGQRLGHVERFGVRGGDRRDQPDVPGRRCNPRGDQERIEPDPYPVHRVGVLARVRVRRYGKGILDRDEVQQPAFRGGDEIGPVRG